MNDQPWQQLISDGSMTMPIHRYDLIGSLNGIYSINFHFLMQNYKLLTEPVHQELFLNILNALSMELVNLLERINLCRLIFQVMMERFCFV